MKHFFHLIFYFGLSIFSLSAMNISPSEAEKIGQGIFFNECGCRKDRLVWWNEGENFASLGIGHFIWYPKGIKGPYEEVFPSLLAFFKQQAVELPDWLEAVDGCPWNTKQELLSEETKKQQLQELLARTIPLQTTFIGKRFENALPKILGAMSEESRKAAVKTIASLEKSPQGKFALIDYLNFKGAGTCETERYQGKGWGLKQVLEEMPLDKDSLQAFAETAKRLLKQRVEGSPQERKEDRWLPGWLSRVDRYLSIQ